MRLETVDRGHSLPRKLMLGMIRLMNGGDPAPDVVRTLFYRPKLFGKAFSECLQETMRGPSEWSVGKRELFAAFVSRVNRCEF